MIYNMTSWAIYQVRSLDLANGQIFKLTFRGQEVHVLMRLVERNTMVFRVFLFLSSKVIRQKLDLPKKATLFV